MRVTDTAVTDRREQILRATVEVVAEQGYHATSFARIIEHAQLSSTRLISYHFESKDALMREALAYVVVEAQQFMQPPIQRARTSRTRLAAYIRSNLDFLAEHPTYARAALEIVPNLTPSEDDAEAADVSVALLEQLFVTAQEAGEMRDFDPTVMAVTLRAAIDRAVGRAANGDTDLGHYADELVEIFERATQVQR
ncbi:TetR/AcrR family transcriptional regulator [Luteipulveratus mongoliensis]|uniref:HTH tetR-type domain-containing protein n=1 Tax=Luteipulveratus mongoliensis TaxID=571913 RepID=A0A0K1JE11_9MICO|nr:TetR/AcrR family transcriptional regulator [Luteipulveratus mongoliensis]AKU14825.1 hypothetical protein VV02_01320 [Luteipulveratus mongoliensis]